jgi:hypothetical protein
MQFWLADTRKSKSQSSYFGTKPFVMNNELTPAQKYEHLIRKSPDTTVPEHETNADFFEKNNATPEGKELIRKHLHAALEQHKSTNASEARIQRLTELQKAIHESDEMGFLIEKILNDLED